MLDVVEQYAAQLVKAPPNDRTASPKAARSLDACVCVQEAEEEEAQQAKAERAVAGMTREQWIRKYGNDDLFRAYDRDGASATCPAVVLSHQLCRGWGGVGR